MTEYSYFNRANTHKLMITLEALRASGRERRWQMNSFIVPVRITGDDPPQTIDDPTGDPNECGSAACLAGWAVMIDCLERQIPVPTKQEEIIAQAAGWLGL